MAVRARVRRAAIVAPAGDASARRGVRDERGLLPRARRARLPALERRRDGPLRHRRFASSRCSSRCRRSSSRWRCRCSRSRATRTSRDSGSGLQSMTEAVASDRGTARRRDRDPGRSGDSARRRRGVRRRRARPADPGACADPALPRPDLAARPDRGRAQRALAIANGLALVLVLVLGLALVPAAAPKPPRGSPSPPSPRWPLFLWIALDRMRPGGAPSLRFAWKVVVAAGLAAGRLCAARLGRRRRRRRRRRVRRGRLSDTAVPADVYHALGCRRGRGGAVTVRPRVVVLRGHHANIGELRPWELLLDRFEIEVVTTSSAIRRSTASTSLGRRRGREGPASARAARYTGDSSVGDAYLDVDGLVRGAAIVHTAELGPGSPPSRLAASVRTGIASSRPCGRRSRSARPFARPERPRTAGSSSRRRISSCRRRSAPAVASCSKGRRRADASGGAGDRRRSVRDDPGRPCRRAPGRVAGSSRVGEGALRRDQSPGGGWGEARLLIVGGSRSGADSSATPTISAWRTGSRSGPSRTTRCRPSSPRRRVVLASLPIPTWEEQFGLVLAEALAAGAPVVASASGAIPEVLAARAHRSSRPVTGSSSRALLEAGPLPTRRPSESPIRPRSSAVLDARGSRAARSSLRARPGASAVAPEDALPSPAGRRGRGSGPLSGSGPLARATSDDVERQSRLDPEELTARAVEQPHDEIRVEDVVVTVRFAAWGRAFAARRPDGDSRSGTRLRSHSSMNSRTCVVSSSPVERAKSASMCVEGRHRAHVVEGVLQVRQDEHEVTLGPTTRLHSDRARSGFAMCSSVWTRARRRTTRRRFRPATSRLERSLRPGARSSSYRTARPPPAAPCQIVLPAKSQLSSCANSG